MKRTLKSILNLLTGPLFIRNVLYWGLVILILLPHTSLLSVTPISPDPTMVLYFLGVVIP